MTYEELEDLKVVYDEIHVMAVGRIDDLELPDDWPGDPKAFDALKAHTTDKYELAESRILQLIDAEIARRDQEQDDYMRGFDDGYNKGIRQSRKE